MECHRENNNRAALRGRNLYRAAYLWRHTKTPSEATAALNAMRKEIDAWLEEDRVEKRPPGY